MKLFVAVTDDGWFEFLSAMKPDEVNFWRPRSTHGVHVIGPGSPFLFKLHSPHNYIVGGGFFVRHSILPVSLAWKAFEEENGTLDFGTFRSRVTALGNRTELDPMIGCTILTEPFFWPREQWIHVPPSWAANIVQGKSYDTETAEGADLWEQVVARIGMPVAEGAPSMVADGARYGTEYLTRGRLGQGTFRVLVTEAYDRRCAISGERTLPVLEAGHIRPFGEGGPSHRRTHICSQQAS